MLKINNRLSRVLIFLGFLCFISFFNCPLSQAIDETHPFILYTSDDIDSIRERLSQEPHRAWFSRVVEEADMILQINVDWDQTVVPKTTQGYYAKMLAFAHAFTDLSSENHNEYGSEAAQALYFIPDSDYKDFFSSDLSISEAAYYWSVTYDILKGADFDFTAGDYPDMESTIRNKLKTTRDYLARDLGEDISFPPKEYIQRDYPSVYFNNTIPYKTDNHHVKLYSSLTMLSLAIYAESGSEDDYSRGKSRFLTVLNNMTITGDNGEPAGGWAEGPGYHTYSMNQYLPALIALRNMGVPDFDALTVLKETHLWLSRIVMPDGHTPPFDDNEAIKFNWSGLLYSFHQDIPESNMLYWMWDNNNKSVKKEFLPEYIAQFDDAPVSYDPAAMGLNPTGFYPESGFARFRSSWDDDAVYMLLLSEHGEARKNGQAHEHPDPNSIIIHAYGDMLLLDSGYGGWEEHDSVRFAENHNLILVDGEGPAAASQGVLFQFWNANGADAYLTEFFTADGLDYAKSTTQYLETDFNRSIIFPDHEYFLMFDRVTSNQERTFTLLLHGNGGGTSGGTFSEEEQGALWERENAVLRSYTVGSSELIFSTVDMNHAVYDRSPMLSHTVQQVSQSGQNEFFLSLLFPERKNVPLPTVSQMSIENGLGIRVDNENSIDYAVIGSGESAVIFDSDFGTYTSDGEYIYVSIDKEGDIRQFFLSNGSSIAYDQNPLILTSNPVNLNMNYMPLSAIEGYVQADELSDTQITVYDVEAHDVSYRNAAIPFDTIENGVSFTISGEGEFKIERKTTSIMAESEEQLSRFTIEQPFPNPFNSSTALNYYLPRNTTVSLVIYNITGGKIAVLDEGYHQSGYYRSVWNGTDDDGHQVSSGIYFYRLSTPDFTQNGKILFLR